MKSDPMPYLKAIFGGDPSALTRAEMGRKSDRKFVRSNVQLAIYELDLNPNATGHVMTAWEAYDTFGPDIIAEAMEYGSAIILSESHAIESSLKNRREELGLSPMQVARASGLTEEDVANAEEDADLLRIQDLEHIAFVLGLDERRLAYDPTSRADGKLAARLKTLWADPDVDDVNLSARSVASLAEAASIVRIQSELQEILVGKPRYLTYEPEPNYGSRYNPAYQIGYGLAGNTRKRLELGFDPIYSMRGLVEDELGIPVIQAELQNEISGATVAATDSHGNEHRGIVLNVKGHNENVWARRITLAHELGHLLYDPDDRLERIRVDSYDGNDHNPENAGGQIDYVEQRANAFAVAFLAPLDAVRSIAPAPHPGDRITGKAVSQIMSHFGLSLTSARYHVSNAHYRQYDTPSHNDIPSTWPSDEWRGAEDFTADYFPIEDTPIQRRGRFAGFVAAATESKLISEQTAAAYLSCGIEDLRNNSGAILSLYPIRSSRFSL